MALQHLFERSTDLISTNSQLKSDNVEVKQNFSDASASVRSLEDEIRRLKEDHQSEVLQLKTDFEEQKSLLLSKLTNPDLEVKEGDFAKYSEFQAKLKKSMKKTKAKKEVRGGLFLTTSVALVFTFRIRLSALLSYRKPAPRTI